MTDQIALAGWSLVRRFRHPEHPLPLLDFPRTARDEFGFDAVELNSPFFAARDDTYLAELRRRAADAKVILLGIAIDREGDLAGLDPDEPAAERRRARRMARYRRDARLPVRTREPRRARHPRRGGGPARRDR